LGNKGEAFGHLFADPGQLLLKSCMSVISDQRFDFKRMFSLMPWIFYYLRKLTRKQGEDAVKDQMKEFVSTFSYIPFQFSVADNALENVMTLYFSPLEAVKKKFRRERRFYSYFIEKEEDILMELGGPIGTTPEQVRILVQVSCLNKKLSKETFELVLKKMDPSEKLDFKEIIFLIRHKRFDWSSFALLNPRVGSSPSLHQRRRNRIAWREVRVNENVCQNGS
jgi:hypothetical protein